MIQIIAMNDLGDIFKSARKSRGWSQDFLAQKSGVPKNTIQNTETGRSKTPNPGTVMRLLAAFECESMDDLEAEYDKRIRRLNILAAAR